MRHGTGREAGGGDGSCVRVPFQAFGILGVYTLSWKLKPPAALCTESSITFASGSSGCGGGCRDTGEKGVGTGHGRPRKGRDGGRERGEVMGLPSVGSHPSCP